MEQKQQKKKRGLIGRIFLILGIVIAALILAAVVLGWNLLNRINRGSNDIPFEEAATPSPSPVMQSPNVGPTPTPSPTPEPLLPLKELYDQTVLTSEQYTLMAEHNANTNQYTNILLLGVDRRGSSGNSRTDTMLIATLDKKNKRLKLTSLLRDTLVEIPGYGEGRLNSAATKGGIDLLMETISANLHIALDRYVLVDFRMFEDIVDEMGGLTVRMSAAEISAANDCIAGLNKEWGVDYLWDGFIFAEAGNVKLTGKQALAYARVRKIDSDFSRTDRQFKILNAVYAKFMSRDLAKQYDLLYQLLPLIETNLSNTEIVSLAVDALGIGTKGLLHYSIPAAETYKSTRFNGSAVLLSDLSLNSWLAHEFIFESAEEPDEAKVLRPGASTAPRTPSPTLNPFATAEPIPGATYQGGGIGVGVGGDYNPVPTPQGETGGQSDAGLLGP